MTVPFETKVAPYITIENAREWNRQTDQLLWIEYNILDNLNLRAFDYRFEYIEEQFEKLLNT